MFARRDRTHKRLWGHTSRVGSINRRTIALAFIPCFAAIATRMAALLIDVPWFAANAVGVELRFERRAQSHIACRGLRRYRPEAEYCGRACRL